MTRLTAVLVSSVACAAGALLAAPADAAPEPGPGPLPRPDRLTVSVDGSTPSSGNGTFTLVCHPAGGTHPHARDACERLDGLTVWGRDFFSPVPDDTACTMQFDGPATAHISGVWAGRPVEADFDLTDGCEIARWKRLVPVLPATSF